MRDKTVLITGESAGVGRSIVHRFAPAGARLGLIARSARALAETRAEAERIGASVVERQAIALSSSILLGSARRCHAGGSSLLPDAPFPAASMYDALYYRGSQQLEGKIALIARGASGIGRSVAVLFAHDGADVAICFLSEDADAEATEAAVEKEGRRWLLVPGRQPIGALHGSGPR